MIWVSFFSQPKTCAPFYRAWFKVSHAAGGAHSKFKKPERTKKGKNQSVAMTYSETSNRLKCYSQSDLNRAVYKRRLTDHNDPKPCCKEKWARFTMWEPDKDTQTITKRCYQKLVPRNTLKWDTLWCIASMICVFLWINKWWCCFFFALKK